MNGTNSQRTPRKELATLGSARGTSEVPSCGGTLGNHTTLHLVMAKDDNGDGGLTPEEDCCQHSLSRQEVVVSS